MHHSIDKIMHF